MHETILKIARLFWRQFLEGVATTLLLSLLGTILGLILAFFLVLLVLRKNPFGYITKIYVAVFRGTPMMVQGMIIYYGLAYAGVFISPFIAGLLTVTLNTAAYLTEVLRGGIQAVDKGQTEAARSLGFSYTQTFFHIILPQGLRNSFPSIGNEFIINIKDTAVLNVISVSELYFAAHMAASRYSTVFEAMILVAVIYFFLTLVTSAILKYIERKMNVAHVGLPSANL